MIESTTAIISIMLIYAGCAGIIWAIWRLYLLPLRFTLFFSKKELLITFFFRVSWGLLGLKIRSSPEGWKVHGEIGHVIVISRPVGQISTPIVPESEEWSMPNRDNVLSLMMTGVRFLPYLLHHLALDVFRADLTVGLGDPAWTGSAYGYYHAIRPLISSEECSVDITPDFSRMTLEGIIQGGMLINTPLDLVIRGIRAFLPDMIRIWRSSSD